MYICIKGHGRKMDRLAVFFPIVQVLVKLQSIKPDIMVHVFWGSGDRRITFSRPAPANVTCHKKTN
jgi:hypothetical protein